MSGRDKVPTTVSNSVTLDRRRKQYARTLLNVIGQGAPEQLGYLGLAGFDDLVADPSVSADERQTRELEDIAPILEAKLETESDYEARIDLIILKDAAIRLSERSALSARLMVRMVNVGEILYQGLYPLLRDGGSPARRRRGLHRLRRYLGDGGRPLVEAAISRVREDIAAKKLSPTKSEIQALLDRLPSLRTAILDLVEKTSPPEGEVLARSLDHWWHFIELELLPLARSDYTLPRQLYALNLRDFGIDEEPLLVAARAHAAYDETMVHWRKLAKEIAADFGATECEPTHVLSLLKHEQKSGSELQSVLLRCSEEIEHVIRRERLVTLPDRQLRFRMATAAEVAMNPSPTIDIEGFLRSDKHLAVLVPGIRIPGPPQYDDFSYAAAAWPLMVHNGRPGHELQFSIALERGISVARTLFAFNAVNVEGWAHYCEEIMRPYMPKQSRFVALQFLLLRQARAFLDPWLQFGRITINDASEVLRGELGVSEALTKTEIQRYTFQSPGQAIAYFFGMDRIRSLRRKTERALRTRFDQRRFHDSFLRQGFAPLSIIAEGVEQELGITP